ncbi:hypothetical protein [Sphingopyxis sp.]|uniref:hypothetical protein n=1 Tax=Sphingopyxis sp. TaxID=1908224 RepID=UPI003BABFFFB
MLGKVPRLSPGSTLGKVHRLSPGSTAGQVTVCSPLRFGDIKIAADGRKRPKAAFSIIVIPDLIRDP